MGSLADGLISPVYLDTNIFVYALEGFTDYEEVLKDLFTLAGKGKYKLITSELTIAEVLVKPMMEGRDDVCNAFDNAIRDSKSLEVVPVSRDILIEAAKIRASQSIRLPDAIHLATAVQSQCSSFLTNDKNIPKITSLKSIYLSDFTS
ncbi:MAG: type II toxin-antitoxin system VapC family toxin [bacterium]|nr:type II toxin-antitoxin system VapC family toxin [bacterium]